MITEIPLPTIRRSINDHAPPVSRSALRKTGDSAKLGKIQTALLGSIEPASTRAKRADRIKLIFWDGTGVCLYAKRLEDGEFRWPKVHDGMMRLTAAQLSALLEGLDWRRVHEARRTRVPAQAG